MVTIIYFAKILFRNNSEELTYWISWAPFYPEFHPELQKPEKAQEVAKKWLLMIRPPQNAYYILNKIYLIHDFQNSYKRELMWSSNFLLFPVLKAKCG